MKTLKKKVNYFPDSPGVYLMKDKGGNILYVGKALSLRKRVKSYFSPTSNPKIIALTDSVSDADYIVTDSQAEALMLECNLIKKYHPRYNVRLRDDKKYPFIKVSAGSFPYICITRTLKMDGSKYYGPYTSAGAVRKAIKLMKKLFMLRSCKKDIKSPSRTCLYYDLEQCIAPCTGKITEEEYGELVHSACLFLEGKAKKLIRQLRGQMKAEGDALHFEKAAIIRDRISALERIFEEQKMVSSSGEDEDYIAFAIEADLACVGLFPVREGKIVGQEQFLLEGVEKSSPSEILSSFVKQYYVSSSFLPGTIFLQEPIDDMELIREWLEEKKGGKVKILIPKRGRRHELIKRLEKNSALRLEEVTSRREEDAVIQLKKLLALEVLPSRIEAFDISQTGGEEAVGSMVVFNGGLPERREYRRFRVQYAPGRDDCAQISEIVLRRYRKVLAGGKELPDLVLVDGGPGQLNSALFSLKELGITDIPVIALAKQYEHVFCEGVSEPLILPPASRALQLMRHIRDEAHRFATGFHRRLRRKKLHESTLDNVPGLGEKRKKLLLNHFQSIEAIKSASAGELEKVGGIGPHLARCLKRYL